MVLVYFSFGFLLYFLILFAFSFRKIINFLLVPLVFKFGNSFFVFFVSLFINRCERPSVGEVGLNSERNGDQPFSPGLWHKPGLMVMGQGRGAKL